MSLEFLWYLPNTVDRGHRGDTTTEGWGSLDLSVSIAQAAEDHGFAGALIGTGWGRPDTFTIAASVAARTRRFKPLIATRPGYWQPAQFACAAATLDQLSAGRVLVNIVSGRDDHLEYGDYESDSPTRYERTREFMRLVRLLWTQESVTFHGRFYRVEHSTCDPRPFQKGGSPLYFGGASAAAEQVAAAEADVQLMWGESLELAAERIERLKKLSAACDRTRPLEFGLRITTVVRETRAAAWQAAQAKLQTMETSRPSVTKRVETLKEGSVGQARLRSLVATGEVLDRCLWTAPAKMGIGSGSTWLVGSAADVIGSLEAYAAIGISHFLLSDTPYRDEAARVGNAVATPMLQMAKRASSKPAVAPR
jgi:alkanesulfonate monooxygenase